MGLFSFNYAKPGPGVDANEPEKKGFFRFWEVIFEKFSKLIGTNALHAALSIPYLIILYIIAPVSGEWLQNLAAEMMQNTNDIEIIAETLSMGLRAMFALGVFMLWGSGPSSAMYSYITRCFTRRDPVWIMSDGFDKFKENFKQGMIVVIIDIAALVLGINALWVYYNFYLQSGGMQWMLLCSLMAMIFVVYTWMHFYIYQIMVTFECTIGQIYRNSLLFAIAGLPINLLLTVLNIVIIVGLFLVISNPLIVIIADLLFLALLMRFPIEFTAARKIRKVIIDAQEKTMPKKEYIDDDGENAVNGEEDA